MAWDAQGRGAGGSEFQRRPSHPLLVWWNFQQFCTVSPNLWGGGALALCGCLCAPSNSWTLVWCPAHWTMCTIMWLQQHSCVKRPAVWCLRLKERNATTFSLSCRTSCSEAAFHESCSWSMPTCTPCSVPVPLSLPARTRYTLDRAEYSLLKCLADMMTDASHSRSSTSADGTLFDRRELTEPQ